MSSQDQQPTHGMVNGVTKVASAGIGAMASTPLALALLIVNIGFLAFAGYILQQVASNARERNHVQNTLISNLVRDIRDCRQPATPQPRNGGSLDAPGPDSSEKGG